MRRGSGTRRVLIWGFAGAVIGLAVALAPFWIGVRSGIPPKGPSCVFESDPGSGTTAAGVERVEWSLTPAVRCMPRGVSAAEARQYGDTNLNLGLYRELWPFAAAALVTVAWAVIFLVGLVLGGEPAWVEGAT